MSVQVLKGVKVLRDWTVIPVDDSWTLHRVSRDWQVEVRAFHLCLNQKPDIKFAWP